MDLKWFRPGEKPSWAEMGATQKAATLVLGLIQIALLAAALWDLQNRQEHELRGDKRWWRMIVFVNYIGPIAYFLLARNRTRLPAP